MWWKKEKTKLKYLKHIFFKQEIYEIITFSWFYVHEDAFNWKTRHK